MKGYHTNDVNKSVVMKFNDSHSTSHKNNRASNHLILYQFYFSLKLTS